MVSPQRDPYNYNLDPLLILGLQALGTHMHQRLASEGKPGATMASGGAYDGWWNGGIRNTGNFHNIIAILTETIGSPTPMRVPLVAQRQIPSRDLPYPIAPQEWRFKSVGLIEEFNRQSRVCVAQREHLLFNIYRRASGDSHAVGRHGTPRRRVHAAGESGWRRGAGPEASAAAWDDCASPSSETARLIIPVEPGGFPHRDKFSPRARGQVRTPRNGGFRSRGKKVSGGVVRGHDAQASGARAGYVRAQDHPTSSGSGRAAHAP